MTPELSKAFDEEYIKYREAFPKREYVMPVDRNEVIEEVAKEIEKMTVFGKDTLDSFTVFIRKLKT
jgi:CRISPR/Cas system-associated exonuclease Cas4 (RecB family)